MWEQWIKVMINWILRDKPGNSEAQNRNINSNRSTDEAHGNGVWSSLFLREVPDLKTNDQEHASESLRFGIERGNKYESFILFLYFIHATYLTGIPKKRGKKTSHMITTTTSRHKKEQTQPYIYIYIYKNRMNAYTLLIIINTP